MFLIGTLPSTSHPNQLTYSIKYPCGNSEFQDLSKLEWNKKNNSTRLEKKIELETFNF